MRIQVDIPTDFDRAASVAVAGDEIVLNCDAVTRGAWAFESAMTLAAGVTLKMQGHNLTLENPDITWTGKPEALRPDRDVAVVRAGRGAKIIGPGTVNCNESALATGERSTWLFISAGIHGPFGHLEITDVTVTGLRGTKAGVGTKTAEIESFAILVNGEDGGSQITRCRVQGCRTAAQIGEDPYITGIVIGHEGQWAATSVVRECAVIVEGAWQAFSANRNAVFSRCSCSGARTACHFDTGVVYNVLFDECVFNGINQGPSVVSVDNSAKGQITWRNCVFQFRKATHLVSVWDQNAMGAKLGPLILDRCSFHVPEGDGPALALVGGNIDPVVFNLCLLPPTVDVSPTAPASNLLLCIYA